MNDVNICLGLSAVAALGPAATTDPIDSIVSGMALNLGERVSKHVRKKALLVGASVWCWHARAVDRAAPRRRRFRYRCHARSSWMVGVDISKEVFRSK